MRRRISSHQTVLVKFILPPLWIGIWGFATLMTFARGSHVETFKWILLGGWVAGTAFMYRTCIRLKEVSVDDGFLYVSNYVKEIVLPLSEIYDVTENLWVNTHPVTIHLKSPSEFGDKITFMPTTRPFAFFSSHPIVEELKELAKSSSMATNSLPRR